MRISHSELQSCLANPQSWYQASLIDDAHPWSMGYQRVLRFTIFHFHKSSASEARAYMDVAVRKNRFKNADRIREIEKGFDRYVKWASQENVKGADTKVNLSYKCGFLELRGEVGRVDVTGPGYRAVLLGNAPDDWENQLRMPLMQAAISSIYGRPQDETAVGFQ